MSIRTTDNFKFASGIFLEKEFPDSFLTWNNEDQIIWVRNHKKETYRGLSGNDILDEIFTVANLIENQLTIKNERRRKE